MSWGCGFGGRREICDLYMRAGMEGMDARSMRRGVTLGKRRRGLTYLAGERNEVVFTEAIDGDLPDQDHLIVIFGEDGIVDNV